MNVPKQTTGGEITLTGKAVPGSTITFYDTSCEIGSTTSNKAGEYRARLELKLAGQYSYHQIHAVVSSELFDEPVRVEGGNLINDESSVTLSKITMIRNEKPYNTEIPLPSNLGQAKQTKKSLVMPGVVETTEKWIVSDTSRGSISWYSILEAVCVY